MFELEVTRRGIVALALLLVAGAAGAQPPAPESLRAERTADAVRLSWQPGMWPYGVYRSSDPGSVLDPVNYVGVSNQTSFDDALSLQPSADVLFYKVDETIMCNGNADCDNGNACDGAEVCTTQFCFPGDRRDCNDGDLCTVDSCDPATGSCGSVALVCDDGDPCTLDTCAATIGCASTVDPAAAVGTKAELAGNALTGYPHFEFARAFNEDAAVGLAVDPTVHPALVGLTCDVYVVESKSALGWCNDRSLVDARGAPDTRSFVAGTVQANTFGLVAPLQLDASAGDGIGHGYDVVVDCDGDAMLDPDELVDGLGDRAGVYLVHDLTRPGPFATLRFDDIGPQAPHCGSPSAGNDDMRVYYPQQLQDPQFAGTFPLVVISHGNGHCYDWYDFLGQHIASYGYIVMSHDNNTGPGIETASTTTLEFTDKILANQHTLEGGVLNGHIDSSRIAWLGHSRGGEGIVRAYDRIVDEGYTPRLYRAEDIVLLSSIAPTDFLGPTQADPHAASYHLLYGSADGDVCGCPNSLYPFAIYERATGFRHSTYVQGADHNDFNCCGFNDFDGPAGTEIGRPEAQQVQKASQLAAIERYVEGSIAAEDYFWRQTESFRPIGVAASTVIVNDYRKAPSARKFVLEDFQTEPSTTVSSSGGTVQFSVVDLVEELMLEADGTFSWDGGAEAMNGMTRARSNDSTRGSVFAYGGGADAIYQFEVPPAEQDWSDDAFLSFRAAQSTRHPLTRNLIEDQTFSVTLEDGLGATSSIRIDAYGGGIEEPYQRGGYGPGQGWQNEFETIRIRLSDFLADGSGIDLTQVRFLRFEFGPSFGSIEGRLGLDDVELTEE